jgi:hypothetical protein
MKGLCGGNKTGRLSLVSEEEMVIGDIISCFGPLLFHFHEAAELNNI